MMDNKEKSKMLAQAFDLYQKRKFKKAQILYRKILSSCPEDFEALHFSGLVAFEEGSLIEAEALLCRALNLPLASAAAYSNYGLVLLELNRLNEAVLNFKKALQLNAKSFVACFNLGIAMQSKKQFSEAIIYYDMALKINPYDAEAFFRKGQVIFETGRFEDSIKCFDNALLVNNNYFEAHFYRGKAMTELRRFDEAVNNFEKVTFIKSDYPEAFYMLGVVLGALNRFDQALSMLEKAINLKLEIKEVFYHRGIVLGELKCFGDALLSFDKAISIDPIYTEAIYFKGLTLGHLRRFEEALENFDAAISLKPDYVEAFFDRGVAFEELLRFNDAFLSYNIATLIKPSYAEARLGKSLILLLMQKFDLGWEEYEGRLLTVATQKTLNEFQKTVVGRLPQISDPISLTGKHLILIDEQGIGDSVMFSSVINDVRFLVTGIDLVVNRRLVAIYESSFPFARVFCLDNYSENDSPNDGIFMFIGSLGRLFRKKISDFPKIPYLHPKNQKVEIWRNRLEIDGKKLIGISWRGGTETTRDWARSARLEEFMTLFPEGNFKFVNIQYKSSEEEIRQFTQQSSFDIVSFPIEETTEIADLCALLKNLKLVVTVQNSNVHLCGALGVPCIGIIPPVPEWRYGLYGEAIPWYESISLVRRQQGMDISNLKPLIHSHVIRVLSQ